VTWRAWDKAGLDYDSSLGYARDPGFRSGVCLEYPVFDLLASSPLALRERPLVAMDVAVVERDPADHDGVLRELATLRERCRMFGGQYTLLWHNSHLASRRDRALYEAAL
jgi:hypothetical protein